MSSLSSDQYYRIRAQKDANDITRILKKNCNQTQIEEGRRRPISNDDHLTRGDEEAIKSAKEAAAKCLKKEGPITTDEFCKDIQYHQTLQKT